MEKIKVGLLGYGTIGQGVIRLIRENREEIAGKLGAEIVLAGVADVDVKRPRKVKVAKRLLTTDPNRIIKDPSIPIVIELVGDWPGVKQMILDSLSAGKSVVTANKALLAKHGDEIIRSAVKNGQDVYYEASVCGTIPIIRVLREGLAANRIEAVYGIVNGTCNYILTGMSLGRGSYKEILESAQRQGFAEAKPEADVEGYDAAHKLAVMLRTGFGVPAKLNQIHREGITRVTAADIEAADHFGYTVKLLAIAKRQPGGIEARVHPTLVPSDSPLAAVMGVYNAVYVTGNFAGPTLYYGKGAGRDPTAAAVMGDVMELARRIKRGDGPRRLPFGSYLDGHEPGTGIMHVHEITSRYYMHMDVLDKPGVLSRVSGMLGKCHISIRSVLQRNVERGPVASIVIMTHDALEMNMQKALALLKKSKDVKGPVRMIRIENDL